MTLSLNVGLLKKREMYKVVLEGIIIDSNIRSLTVPKAGDQVVANGILYVVETVDLNLDSEDKIIDISVNVIPAP